MSILDEITSDDLQEMGYKWAEIILGSDWSDDMLKGFAYETFVDGFMAGAIQIRAIIEEFGNEKEAE